MSDAASANPLSGRKARKRWAICLALVTVVWTLAMLASLYWGFLDRFIVAADSRHIGWDFFLAPRAFHNLLAGNSIFLTEISDYGPYATSYVQHPCLALAVGPWTAPLRPWVAFGAFDCVSVALLLLGAWRLAKAFDDPLGKVFPYFALLGCFPVYAMLWAGQMNVFLVLALALILGGLMGLEKEDRTEARGGAEERGRGGGTADAVILSAAKNLGQTATSARFFAALRMTTHARFSPSPPLPVSPSSSAHRWIQLGLLISLLSKPLVALLLPVLFVLPETRRKLLLPIAVYAALSLVFLLVPWLNPGHYNGIHWLYIFQAPLKAKVAMTLVNPATIDLTDCLAIYSLPMLLNAGGAGRIGLLLAKLPLAAALLTSLAPLMLPQSGQRIRAAVVAVALCILAYNLSYFQGWEYHYTTLLPLLPAMLWLWQRESVPWLRRLLLGCFVASLPLFLPTPSFLAPDDPGLWALSALQRVVPVIVAFCGLLIYGVTSAWRDRRGGHLLPPLSPLHSPLSPLHSPLSPLLSSLCLGGLLALLLGSVGATVYATVPARLLKETKVWTPEDWMTHLEDLISRPGVAPAVRAAAYEQMGRRCLPTDPGTALKHYREAAALEPRSPQLCAELGNAFFRLGQFDEAVRQDKKVLELQPGDPEVHNDLGAALFGCGRLDEAVSHFRKALKLKPDYAEAHYNLGLALAACGRAAEAIDHYQRALQIDPDCTMALNDLAWLRATCPEAALRDGRAAVALARRAVSLSGGRTPEWLDTLAAAYAETGMFSQATATASQALDLARQQQKTVLVENLKTRLLLYDVETPYRQPPPPGAK